MISLDCQRARLVRRAVLLLMFAYVCASGLRAQDSLPPDAEAILNPTPSPEESGGGKGAMPSLDELTDPASAPPISFQTTAPAAPIEEVAGLPPAEKQNPVEPRADPASPSARGESVGAVRATDRMADSSSLSWLLGCSIAIFLIPAGLTLVSAGLTRAKNVGHTMSLSFAAVTGALLGFWAVGFGLQMGGVNSAQSVRAAAPPGVATALDAMVGVEIGGSFAGLAGARGFGLAGGLSDADLVQFIYQAALVAVFASALAGTLAERTKFSASFVICLCGGALVHPLNAAWTWGGGWLAAVGRDRGLGHGFVDPGGACAVHLVAGALAFAAAITVGARYGKYNRDGSVNPIPGHNLTYVFLGTFLAIAGWLGLGAGSATVWGLSPAGVISCVLMGALGGAFGGILAASMVTRKPDPSLFCPATVAGLVSVSGLWGFVDPATAAFVGFVGGVLAVFGVLLIERRMRLDDPAGVMAVHGLAGLWGALALGLMANGKAGAGLNGVEGPVQGLFGGANSQLAAQAVGVAACIAITMALGFIGLSALKMIIGLRVDLRDEVAGLDLGELGALGYQPDLNPEPKRQARGGKR